jgi:hypothetical protein
MKKALCIVPVLALAWPVAIEADNQPAPAQAERGRELFLKSSRKEPPVEPATRWQASEQRSDQT